MADNIHIRAEALGKKYLIGHEAGRERYVALRDVMTRFAGRIARTAADILHGNPLVYGNSIEEFWALRNVNFEIKRGEVVGIIGRNGAGKSTLLKILSRITEPTTGRVEITGRVASLLEVGTGFHPELTGRENIYLNGAILGMTRAEIKRKFDEIVAFAGTERFLDTPVKRYSSGMYVRLAFAVAAHLEPEILVVDEVLAVGDAEFQKKCLGKMKDVAGHGRTVLFVSHNIGAVRQLCDRGLVLRDGEIIFDGDIEAATNKHADLSGQTAPKLENSWDLLDAPGSDLVRLRWSKVTSKGSDGFPFSPSEDITVAFGYEQLASIVGLRCVLRLLTVTGELAFASSDENIRYDEVDPGFYVVSCVIPKGLLNRLHYVVRIELSIPRQVRYLPQTDIAQFSVDGPGNEGARTHYSEWPGLVCPKLDWQIKKSGTGTGDDIVQTQ